MLIAVHASSRLFTAAIVNGGLFYICQGIVYRIGRRVGNQTRSCPTGVRVGAGNRRGIFFAYDRGRNRACEATTAGFGYRTAHKNLGLFTVHGAHLYFAINWSSRLIGFVGAIDPRPQSPTERARRVTGQRIFFGRRCDK